MFQVTLLTFCSSCFSLHGFLVAFLVAFPFWEEPASICARSTSGFRQPRGEDEGSKLCRGHRGVEAGPGAGETGGSPGGGY